MWRNSTVGGVYVQAPWLRLGPRWVCELFLRQACFPFALFSALRKICFIPTGGPAPCERPSRRCRTVGSRQIGRCQPWSLLLLCWTGGQLNVQEDAAPRKMNTLCRHVVRFVPGSDYTWSRVVSLSCLCPALAVQNKPHTHLKLAFLANILKVLAALFVSGSLVANLYTVL